MGTLTGTNLTGTFWGISTTERDKVSPLVRLLLSQVRFTIGLLCDGHLHMNHLGRACVVVVVGLVFVVIVVRDLPRGGGGGRVGGGHRRVDRSCRGAV